MKVSPTNAIFQCLLAKIIFLGIVWPSYCQDTIKGQITDTVTCRDNSEQTYSLFLPSHYDSAHKWPVIFFFEPAARGRLPVRKYASLAEEMGYILIGSNNSRNGSWDIAFNAGDAMLQDAFERYSLDENRIFTSGFSGGGRAATAIAVLTGKISGIISCGAGLPNLPHYSPARGSKIDYISVVGDRDMNYLELLLLEDYLNEIEINNNRVVFDGIHEWPPVYAFREALLWIGLQSYNDNINDEYDISNSFNFIKNRADSLSQTGNLLEAHRILSELIQNYVTHINTTEVRNSLKELEDNRDYKKQLKTQKRIIRQEKEYQNLIFQAFLSSERNRLKTNHSDSTSKTPQWWFDEIDKLKRASEKVDDDKRLMALRLLNLIWARFAESSFNLSSNGDLELALEFVKIWLYAQPNNTWAHWNIAKLYAQTADVDLTIKHLEEIRKRNPEVTASSITSEKVFSNLKDNELMKKFLSKLK